MSTKIYGGFVIKNTDWATVLQKCMQVSKEIKIAAKPQILEYFDKNFEKDEYGLPNLNKSLVVSDTGSKWNFFDIADIIRDYDRSESYNSIINESLSAVFYPDPDGSSDIYGSVFGSQRSQDIFFSITEATEYAYWNNTDPPENMSDEEWEYRKDKWDRMVPTFKFSESGFSFEFATNHDLFYYVGFECIEEINNQRRAAKSEVEKNV